MAIEFRCPSGHRLSCPDEMAGRAAKCPKCGATVHIPDAGSSVASSSDSGVPLPNPEAPAESGNGEQPSSAASGISPEAQAEGSNAGTRQETIVFLCPNNHKLTSPASLQGRPGKCPHCGAKFLIPMLEQSAGEEGEAFLESLSGETDTSDAVPDEESYGDEAGEGEPAGLHFDLEELGIVEDEDNGYVDEESRDVARLFVQLWRQRTDQVAIDLYLKGGEIVTPDWFAPQLSRRTYGMFASQADDGSFSLTVVHWNTVERISVRGLDGLPEGMFE